MLRPAASDRHGAMPVGCAKRPSASALFILLLVLLPGVPAVAVTVTPSRTSSRTPTSTKSPPLPSASVSPTRSPSRIVASSAATASASASASVSLSVQPPVAGTTSSSRTISASPAPGASSIVGPSRTATASAGASASADPKPSPTAFPSGPEQIKFSDTWKYFATGVAPVGTGPGGIDKWSSAAFVDNTWSEGRTPAGYGFLDIITDTPWGATSASRYKTTYFRKGFQFSRAPGTTYVGTLTMELVDGCVVYLNDVEVGRVNMPAGTITQSTSAMVLVPVANALDKNTVTIPNTRILDGANTIAVELHKSSSNRITLRFNAQLLIVEGAASPSASTSPAPGASPAPSPDTTAAASASASQSESPAADGQPSPSSLAAPSGSSSPSSPSTPENPTPTASASVNGPGPASPSPAPLATTALASRSPAVSNNIANPTSTASPSRSCVCGCSNLGCCANATLSAEGCAGAAARVSGLSAQERTVVVGVCVAFGVGALLGGVVFTAWRKGWRLSAATGLVKLPATGKDQGADALKQSLRKAAAKKRQNTAGAGGDLEALRRRAKGKKTNLESGIVTRDGNESHDSSQDEWMDEESGFVVRKPNAQAASGKGKQHAPKRAPRTIDSGSDSGANWEDGYGGSDEDTDRNVAGKLPQKWQGWKGKGKGKFGYAHVGGTGVGRMLGHGALGAVSENSSGSLAGVSKLPPARAARRRRNSFSGTHKQLRTSGVSDSLHATQPQRRRNSLPALRMHKLAASPGAATSRRGQGRSHWHTVDGGGDGREVVFEGGRNERQALTGGTGTGTRRASTPTFRRRLSTRERADDAAQDQLHGSQARVHTRSRSDSRSRSRSRSRSQTRQQSASPAAVNDLQRHNHRNRSREGDRSRSRSRSREGDRRREGDRSTGRRRSSSRLAVPVHGVPVAKGYRDSRGQPEITEYEVNDRRFLVQRVRRSGSGRGTQARSQEGTPPPPPPLPAYVLSTISAGSAVITVKRFQGQQSQDAHLSHAHSQEHLHLQAAPVAGHSFSRSDHQQQQQGSGRVFIQVDDSVIRRQPQAEPHARAQAAATYRSEADDAASLPSALGSVPSIVLEAAGLVPVRSRQVQAQAEGFALAGPRTGSTPRQDGATTLRLVKAKRNRAPVRMSRRMSSAARGVPHNSRSQRMTAASHDDAEEEEEEDYWDA